MRRPHRQSLRRRDALLGFKARWLRRWEEVRVHLVRSPQALAVLAVLAGILVLFAGSGAGVTSRHTSAATLPKPALRAAAGRSRVAPALPAVGLWRDIGDGTTYTVRLQLQPNSDSVFILDFTTPLGEQIQATFQLFQLADSTYAQGIGIANGDPALPATAIGCTPGFLLSDSKQPTPIAVSFLSHISQDGLAAFATLSYIASDQKSVRTLCAGLAQKGVGVGALGGATTYQLQAGCTLDSCDDLTAAAGPAVDQYDAAVLAAEQNGSVANWSSVYKETSQQITAQYPVVQDFATLLNQQVASVGKITQISEPASPPAPEYTPEGQAYFEIQQTVTVVGKGGTSTRKLISYYLLESGAWHFWFSD
jgi:hypothetical protein